MSKPIKSFYEATKYLGQYISLKPELKFLVDTSCMSPERRKQLALFDVLQSMIDTEKDKDIILFFKSFLIPLIEKLGYAEWIRDTVTDLAMKKGFTGGDEEDITEVAIVDSGEPETSS